MTNIKFNFGLAMIFKRDIQAALLKYAAFPTVAILGPRQSGKTTLARNVFSKHTFVSFDDIAVRNFATEDPWGFFKTYDNPHGIIIDEFQYVPTITSYIKQLVDSNKRPGYFILTGSENFLMNSAITESLAGRIGILHLLPLSLHEMSANGLLSDSVTLTMYNGSYPRIYNDHLEPEQWYPSYIQSYVERDVRQLVHVGNLATFTRFLSLCAGRIGQLLNLQALALECGISGPTAKSWLSLLQASYVIFLLEPHFNNFNKRLVKTPKLYFYDTGLACSLLRINSAQSLDLSVFKGPLFESLIISDLYKQYCNRGMRPSVYFWRDRGGAHEVDCILDEGSNKYPIEIKSSHTITSQFFSGVDYWNEIANNPSDHGYIVYAGTQKQKRTRGNVVGWKDAGTLLETILNNR